MRQRMSLLRRSLSGFGAESQTRAGFPISSPVSRQRAVLCSRVHVVHTRAASGAARTGLVAENVSPPETPHTDIEVANPSTLQPRIDAPNDRPAVR